MNASSAEKLAREYATSERLERRRANVTGWVRGEEAWDDALAAVAGVRPTRVLDAGCGDGLFARAIAAPYVLGVDNAPAMVARARLDLRDTKAYTLWGTRADLQAYLDAFVELLGPLDAPAEPFRFKVTRRNRVYVADKAP